MMVNGQTYFVMATVNIPMPTYEGAWKNNKENGYGTHNDVSGWTYTGERKGDLRHEKGKIAYKDTSYYNKKAKW